MQFKLKYHFFLNFDNITLKFVWKAYTFHLVIKFNLCIVLFELHSEEIPEFEIAGLCRFDPFILDQPENNSLWENCFN